MQGVSVLEGVPSALIHSASWCARISEDEAKPAAGKARPAWAFAWEPAGAGP
jgi:hypothetical protein